MVDVVRRKTLQGLITSAASVVLPNSSSQAFEDVLRQERKRLNQRELLRLDRVSQFTQGQPNLEKLVYTSSNPIKKSDLGQERKLYFGPVIFNWFRATGFQHLDGQWQNSWLSSDGRNSWDGSVEFQERHSLLAMRAGFNFLFSQVPYGFEQEQINQFISIKNLEDVEYRLLVAKQSEKYFTKNKFTSEDPRKLNNLLIAPYFAAESFPCYDCDKDFDNDKVMNRTYNHIKNWFVRFLSVMDAKNLATVNGKVLAGLWYVPGAFQVQAGFFEQLNQRLKQDLGFECHWSTHYSWKNGGPDEVNYLFTGMEPDKYNEKGNADLLVGFWPPTKEQSYLYLQRNGGLTYRAALERANSKTSSSNPPKIIIVESLREITEGSDGLPSSGRHPVNDPHWSGEPNYKVCFSNPCHPVLLEDHVSNSVGPEADFETLIASREFSDRNYDSLFLK